MYYYVKDSDIESERSQPGTTSKHASFIGSSIGGLFLWAQAMYLISQLLIDGLLHVNELDPIRRHQPSHSRPRKGGRYSVFQVCQPMLTQIENLTLFIVQPQSFPFSLLGNSNRSCGPNYPNSRVNETSSYDGYLWNSNSNSSPSRTRSNLVFFSVGENL